MFAVLLPAILLAVSIEANGRSRCWSSGNGQPAKWWNEGERLDRGKYFYECRGGQLSPLGCFSSTGDRVQIGQTFERGGYVERCVLGSDGYLQFEFAACKSLDGRTRQPGETWNDPQNMYYYECSREAGNYLRLKVKGCVAHDKSRKLTIGEKYDHGDYTYECQQKSNGTVQMCSVGCVSGGQHYKVGEQWPASDFVYYCKKNGGRCTKKVIGCVYEGKQLYDGDRYKKADTVYQCQIRADSYGSRPVGCISRDNGGSPIDRVIGCRWYVQNSDSKIEQTCELDGEKTKVVTVGCIYRHNGFDTIFLNPGSYTIWNPPRQNSAMGLACKPTTHGATLDVFPLEQMGHRVAGLKYDIPRGK